MNKTLTQTLKEKEEAARAAAASKPAADLVTKEQMAAWFDERVNGADVILPTYLHASNLYDSVGSLTFEGCAPDQVLALLDIFEPLEFGVYVGTFTRVMPVEAYLRSEQYQREKPQQRVTSFLRMQLERTAPQYPTQVKVGWWTRFSEGKTMEMSCAMNPAFMPQLWADTSYFGETLVALKNHKVVWPKDAPELPRLVQYAGGSRTSYPTPHFGGAVGGYLKWADEQGRQKRVAMLAAFEEARGTLTPEPYSPYPEAGAGGLAPKEQHDCLQTLEARMDCALAMGHWATYCHQEGITDGGSYFNHYEWACHWLAKHDLLVHKNGLNGQDYKYGAGLGMNERDCNNSELLYELMEAAKCGPIMQLFIITAIECYATNIQAAEPGFLGEAGQMISESGWKAAAAEVLEALDNRPKARSGRELRWVLEDLEDD